MRVKSTFRAQAKSFNGAAVHRCTHERKSAKAQQLPYRCVSRLPFASPISAAYSHTQAAEYNLFQSQHLIDDNAFFRCQPLHREVHLNDAYRRGPSSDRLLADHRCSLSCCPQMHETNLTCSMDTIYAPADRIFHWWWTAARQKAVGI